MKNFKKNKLSYFVVFVCATGGFSWFNLVFPQCVYSESLEKSLRVASYFFAFFFVSVAIVSVVFNYLNKFFVFLVFFISGLMVLTAQYRDSQMEKYYWLFDGVVSNKFESKNHAAKTITISGINYELIPLRLWSEVEKGDFVSKEACSPFVNINERRFNIFKNVTH